MLTQGIINPQLASLLCRVRHTNMLVIADYAFPYWKEVETVDLSLVIGIPTILQVLEAILPSFKAGTVYMAQEFKTYNTPETLNQFQKAFRGAPTTFEPHVELKKRVPHAIGLIRTGDQTIYSNLILVSA
ncbi:MAG: RbsD/FucU domain-containing protein [Verrucomicrobiales bacterium]